MGVNLGVIMVREGGGGGAGYSSYYGSRVLANTRCPGGSDRPSLFGWLNTNINLELPYKRVDSLIGNNSRLR